MAARPDRLSRCGSGLRIAFKSLARRYLALHDEIADLDAMIAAIVDELAPNLVARNSIGHTGAAQLLLTAGDNPERLRSEASFASLCGVSPVPASSGKTVRHRLNRGGDRAANSALHRGSQIPASSVACATCGKPHIECKMPHEELQFSAASLETRFSHWRRPQASVDHAAVAAAVGVFHGCAA
jgi:transposase